MADARSGNSSRASPGAHARGRAAATARAAALVAAKVSIGAEVVVRSSLPRPAIGPARRLSNALGPLSLARSSRPPTPVVARGAYGRSFRGRVQAPAELVSVRSLTARGRRSSAMAKEPSEQKYSFTGFNPHLAFAIGAAALGSSFQHGFNTGVVNSPAEVIKNWTTEINLNRSDLPLDQDALKAEVTVTWAVAVSIFCVGGMIGGALVGTVADRFGRKGSLLLNNIFVLAAVLFEALAKPLAYYEFIIVGRFLIGINSGLNAGLTPMYLAEISPMHLRGAVGTVYQLIITISILVAQVLGMTKLMGNEQLWPWLLSLTIVPAIVQVITLPFCPESPKYLLLSRGRDMDAQRALTWLRGTIEVHDEMEEMRSEYDSIKLIPRVTFTELIMNSSLRIPLLIAVMIMLAQQLSGINAIMFYSTKIFMMASLTEDQAQNATIGVGVVNVLMTFVSMILVEKAGRKTLLLIGFFGMFIDTTLLAICLLFKAHAAASIMSVALVVMFIVLFATGPGSIPWFLVSELFNQSARPSATSVAIAINWGANFLVGIMFPPLADAIGSNVFFIFAVLQGLFTLFIWLKVPETKNKTIEEISSMFRQQSYQ